jgi:hypothetical protein
MIQEPTRAPMNADQRKAFHILTAACVISAAGLAYLIFYVLDRMVPMPWRPGQWFAYGLAGAAFVAALCYFAKLVLVTVRYRRSFE